MKFSFTVERSQDGNLIRSCSAQEITLREHVIRHSAILSAGQILLDWPPATVEELTAAHLEAALALGPEVILLGTGARQRFPAPEVLRPAQLAGVGVEVMDTPAACRTYNVLVQEGRHVVAALIVEASQKKE